MKRLLALVLILWTASGVFRQADGEDEFKPSVDFKGSRFAFGYLNSGNHGSYPDGSLQMPDAKLRFNFIFAPDIKVVTRFNLNNAEFKSVDYLYMEYTNFLSEVSDSFKDGFFNPSFRFGRFKLDLGEETFGNNLVDGALISNSAPSISGDDEAFMLFQILPAEKAGVPMKWSLTLANGNSGTGADNEQAKSIGLKYGINPIEPLYASVTYYDSGDLGASKSEVSYAGLTSLPANSTEWKRTLMEFDIRFDLGLGKEKRINPVSPAFSDSAAFFRFAYGVFSDDGTNNNTSSTAEVTDREGDYYFIEGVYNPTPRIYTAARYSFVGFDEGFYFDSLNGVNANSYKRFSFGAGYRLTDNIHIKAEYAINSEDIPDGTTERENNQFSILFTLTF